MTIANIMNELPKSAGRRKDFDYYQSKSAFAAEADKVSKGAREQIKNELTNIFNLHVHESGKFVAVTLSFTGKGIAKEEQNKYVVLDCTGDTVQAEFAPSIKEAKNMIRAKLATDGASAADKAPAPAAEKSAKATKATSKSKATKKPAAAKAATA